MAVMTSKLFEMPVGRFIVDALRNRKRGGPAHDEVPVVAAAPSNDAPVSADQSRYARMLERELDREILTEVEREDSDMLARVRDALYADD